MAISRRNRKLIERVGGQILPYDELPRPAQRAIFTYVSEGEYKGDLRDLQRQLAKSNFGYSEIPAAILAKEIAEDPDIAEEFGDFESYHQWYLKLGGIPDYPPKNRWPVILSPFEDETLQDGWHRLHDYYRKGARKIPVVWFPR